MNLAEATKNRPLPGSLGSGWLVSRLFFRITLGRKRIIWIGLLMMAPVAIATYWRIAGEGSGIAFFSGLTLDAFLTFLAVGLPLYLGVSAIRDEIDDKTIVYLFARPLHRAVIVGGKVLSVALVVAVALAVDVALVYLIAVSADGVPALGANILVLLQHAGTLALAATVYTTLFSFVGVLLRRPMILAIIIGVGWELSLSNVPGAFPKLTLMYYLRSLLGVAPESSGPIALLLPSIGTSSAATSLGVLLGAALVFFVAALLVGSRREYRV